jgi:hypothetical protein
MGVLVSGNSEENGVSFSCSTWDCRHGRSEEHFNLGRLNLYLVFIMFGISPDSPLNGIILLLLAIAFVWLGHSATKRNKKSINSLKQELQNFGATKVIMGTYDTEGIAINETDDLIMLFGTTKGTYIQKTFPYNSIMSAEIFENGTSISKSVRSSLIGRAIIGGALAGGAGAVVGGLSGKRKTTEEISDIYLHIIVNDINLTSFNIYLLESPCTKGDVIYNRSMNKAHNALGIIDIIIKRAEQKNGETNSQNNSTIKTSAPLIADELKKLTELFDAGVLTETEYIHQKSKLLNNN